MTGCSDIGYVRPRCPEMTHQSVAKSSSVSKRSAIFISVQFSSKAALPEGVPAVSSTHMACLLH